MAAHGRGGVGGLGGRAGQGYPRGRRPMTDRARVSSLPDGTPVGALPLPRVAINRLRVAGVLTLGDLRAMRDHDLLRLRAFDRYAGGSTSLTMTTMGPLGPGSRPRAAFRASVPRGVRPAMMRPSTEPLQQGRPVSCGVGL